MKVVLRASDAAAEGASEARIEDDTALAGEIRTVARGSALTVVGYVCSALLQSLLAVAVTRGVGVAAAGVFFEAVALFTILANWTSLGADTGCVRELPRLRALGRLTDAKATISAALIPVVLVSIAMAVAIYALAPAIASWIFDEATEAAGAESIRLLAPFIPLAAGSAVMLAASRGFGTMLPYVGVQNIALPAVRIAGIVAVTLAGLGTAAIALAWGIPLGGAALAAFVALLTIIRRAQQRATKNLPAAPLTSLARSFWRFAAPRSLAAAFGTTITWLDVLLVGAYASTRDAAIYAAASRLALVGTYALYAVGMAVSPQFSRLLARREYGLVRAVYEASTSWLVAAGWPLYLTLAIFAPVCMAFFGASYVAGQWALTILAVAGLANFATGNVTLLLLMAGGSGWNLFNSAAALASNVGLNLLLIPRYGIEGAALAWAISIILNNLLALVETWAILGFRPFSRSYLVAAASAAASFGGIGLAVRLLFGATPRSLAFFLITAVPIYAVLMWVSRSLLRLPLRRQSFLGRRGSSRVRYSRVSRSDELLWIARILAGGVSHPGGELVRRGRKHLGTGSTSFSVLPAATRPRLLVPLCSRDAAARTLARHRSSRRVVRAVNILASVALRAGVPTRVLPNPVTIAAPNVVGDLTHVMLSERLKELLGRADLAFAIVVNPGRPQKKPVLEVMDQSGDLVAYAKVGWNELTRALVRSEADALARIADAKPRSFKAPGILASEHWNGLYILVVTPFDLPGRPRLLMELPLAATAEVLTFAATSFNRLTTGAFWRTLRTEAEALDHRVMDLALQIFETLERQVGDLTLPAAFSHGDWVPWNMALLDDSVAVWDWERASDGVPAGLDAIQFLFQVQLNLCRRAPAEAIANTVEEGRDLLPRLGLPTEAIEALIFCHTLQAIIRIHHGRAAGIANVISPDRYIFALEALAERLPLALKSSPW